jgi:23S rRNA (cytosine1962-C5)-methyltransferase
MGRAGDFSPLKADAFDALRDLRQAGERFGLVVCDPPAFAPAKPALAAGLRAYERVARLAAGVVEPEGWLVLCSCSHAADAERFAAACARGIRAAGRQAALVHVGRAGPDHPVHPGLPETSYLKAMVYRLA